MDTFIFTILSNKKYLKIKLTEKMKYVHIYHRDAPTYNKDTCTTMFITALFIIARSWKEPRCPSVDE